MIEKEIARIKLYQFDILAAVPEIKHFVSGRKGGKSEGGLNELNLSYNVNDDPENVDHNRWLLASTLDVPAGKLVFPQQTHSTNVKLINRLNYTEEHKETDALITNTKGIFIGVMSADCVPILIYDPVHKAVAAIHAGWRGTIGKIVERTLKAMVENFGTGTSEIIACLGPSICQEEYEVGPEVVEEFEKVFGKEDGLIKRSDNNKGYLDLTKANKLQLLEMGVKSANIEVSDFCTYQDNDKFFSARRSKNSDGRFAAGIMIV